MQNKLAQLKFSAILMLAILFAPIGGFSQPRIPDINGIKEISVDMACKLIVKQGNKALLEITGDKAELDEVQFKISGDRLKIYNEKKNQHKNEISITIIVPELENLSIGGAVTLITPEPVYFKRLSLDVSGVADMDLKLKADYFKMEASGVISGKIKGFTNEFRIEISGVGKFDAAEFKAQKCLAEVSGVAKIAIHAVDILEAEVLGMGNINYAGNPKINANTSGAGKIRRL